MVQCNICNATFSSVTALRSHEKKHKEDDKGYECPECGKIIKTKQNLSIHINTIHKGLKYKCEHCEKEFTNLVTVKIHFKNNSSR